MSHEEQTIFCMSFPFHLKITLTGTSRTGNERGHVRVHSSDLKSLSIQQDEMYEKSQVVAVGTALPTLGATAGSQQAQVVVSMTQ